jgi:cysteinyl-tRNA synthetase
LDSVVEALFDDLQTKKASDALQPRMLRRQFSPTQLVDSLERIYASQILLGFDLKNHPKAIAAAEDHDGVLSVVRNANAGFDRAREIAEQLDKARAEKDYATADRLREGLLIAGVEVRTGGQKTLVSPTDAFDPSKLERLE